jgi:hypothetical protein
LRCWEARRAIVRGGWAQAADKRVTNMPNAVSVRDYSFEHACMYRYDVQSRQCADRHLLANAYGLMRDAPELHPSGVENCYPPSVAAVMSILGVYEVNLCSKGCIHWWFYMPHIAEHFRTCSLRGGCEQCLCPHFHTCRFVKDKKGIHGAVRCWFFLTACRPRYLTLTGPLSC